MELGSQAGGSERGINLYFGCGGSLDGEGGGGNDRRLWLADVDTDLVWLRGPLGVPVTLGVEQRGEAGAVEGGVMMKSSFRAGVKSLVGTSDNRDDFAKRS